MHKYVDRLQLMRHLVEGKQRSITSILSYLTLHKIQRPGGVKITIDHHREQFIRHTVTHKKGIVSD